jgi:Domain of unknown function (DUF222)
MEMISSPHGEGAVGAPTSPADALSADLFPSADLADLRRAVLRVTSEPRPTRTAEQVGADLIELRHLCDLLELRFARDVAEFAATDEYDVQAAASPYAWISHNRKMGAHAAWSAICVGEMARRHTPLTVAALEEGRVGFGHLVLLAGVARSVTVDSVAAQEAAYQASLRERSDAVPADNDASSAPSVVFDEAVLLRLAEHHTVSRFRQDCAHARHAGDPEGFLAEHLDTVECRSLQLVGGSSGIMTVRGVLDSVGGAALRTALEPLARADGADDARLISRRLADALVELANHGLDNGLIPQRASQRTHLQVTTSLETLLGIRGAPAAELEFSSPIAAETVARLACDAAVTRIVLDSASAVIDVGRSRRVVSGATRRALNVRDGGCRWPGCDRSASWTAAHHVIHWTHGGPTRLPNLVLLCHRHHWLVHEGGWQIVQADGGLLTVPPAPGVHFGWRQPAQWPRPPDESVAA